jgi:hypothetical protein
MTVRQRAYSILAQINFKRDAITKMGDAIGTVYGPDEALSDDDLAAKNKTMEIYTTLCEETIDQMIDDVVNVYVKYYTLDELEQLESWYASPLGQKVLAESKNLHGDVGKVLDQWGTNLWNVLRIRLGWTTN